MPAASLDFNFFKYSLVLQVQEPDRALNCLCHFGIGPLEIPFIDLLRIFHDIRVLSLSSAK